MAQTIRMPARRPRRAPTRQRRVLLPPRESKLWDSGDNGRAWINGSEVGGPDARYAHLDRSYD